MKILALTEEKWKLFEQFFSKNNRGRPHKWSDHQILEAVLYVLHTGCQWRQLPHKYPPHQTVYGRFRSWEEQGILGGIRDMIGTIFVEEDETGFIDGTFVRAMCGGDHVGRTKIGKGSKIMTIVNEKSQPLSAIATSANPHEITLVEDTLADLPEGNLPKILVGDGAYDSDPHDEKLAQKSVELIAPHRKNRASSRTQCPLRFQKYYGKRWTVERFFAWMKPARRLLNRFEKKLSVFQAFLDLFVTFTLIKDFSPQREVDL